MDNRPTSSFGLPTQRAAAPTVEASQRESRLARDIQEGPAVQLAGYSQNFGQVAFPHDPEDTQRELKGQLMYDPAVRRKYLGVDRAEPGAGAPAEPSVQVTVPLTDGDVSYYAKKRAEDEHLAFMQYAASKFNLTDPAQAEIFRRINPEYFTAQMAYIDSRLDTMKRWLSIRTVGIQSMEDITFLWMLDTGRLSLPVGYATFNELSKAGEWREAAGGAAAGIYEKGAAQQHGRLGYNNKGIFNPMRLFAADSTVYPIDKFGWSSTGDIARVPDHRSGGTYGVYSSGQRVGATPTAEGNARRAGQAFIQPAL